MPRFEEAVTVVDRRRQVVFSVDRDGTIVANRRGRAVFHVDRSGKLILNELVVETQRGEEILHVNQNGTVSFGEFETKGNVEIKDEDGKLYAVFRPHYLLLVDTDSAGEKRSISINAAGHALGLYNSTGSESTVLLEGKSGEMRLRDTDGKSRMCLTANDGNVYLGGNDADGDIFIFPGKVTHDIPTNAGTAVKEATIHLDGESGDIKLRNADCAEDFEVLDGQDVEPGSVMVIEQEGKLRQSTKAYDKRVAGVISGAGGNKPGIVLGRDPSNGKAMPVALSGRVWCKVDAQHSPIQVGDLLTTSPTPGHAMKADDPMKAFGAVIGKALQPLDNGRGLVPILVALQ